jgi:hypothetical protein
MENLLSTKFILATLIIIGVLILAGMRVLEVDKLLTTIEIIYGSFVAGNVVSKFSSETK